MSRYLLSDAAEDLHRHLPDGAPFPPLTAYKHRTRGSLSVSGDHAVFQPKSGDPIVLDHVQKVTKGWKGSPYGTPMAHIVDTYVEVIYGDQNAPSVAFFNDPRWLWLGCYLPHRALVQSLEGLVSAT
jgi:hypothetical protein